MKADQQRAEADVIASLLNIEGLDTLSPEEAQGKLSEMLAELAFPMLRAEFTRAAVDRLTKWTQKIGNAGSDAQNRTSEKISRTILGLYKDERLHDAAISLLPEFGGLKDGARKKNDNFKDREVEILAGLLIESVGPEQSCKSIPDMFREASHARLAEKRQMQQFSNLLRLSALIPAA